MLWTGPRIELDDVEGIKKLLELCKRLAKRAAADADFQRAAAGLDGDSIWRLVRDRIRYRFDPRDIELVVDPVLLFQRARDGLAEADCEDIATLAAALALVNGIPARLVAYGTGERWYHIAAELDDGGRWIAVDPVAGNRIDTRPTLARETEGNMPRMMVEGVSGILDIFTGLGEGAKRLGQAVINPATWEDASSRTAKAMGTLAEGATSIVEALSPGVELYGQYRQYRKGPDPAPSLPDPAPSLPAASVLQMAPTVKSMDTPAPIVSVVPYGPAPPPAGIGIDSKTLLIGGAVLAALLLLKK